MEEFFTFMLKAVVVFSVFWYLGVNFFKHSHEISAWMEKRRLKKLADQHKDRVVDVTKVYKEQFGFLESAEYIQGRVKEIKESLSDKNRGKDEVKVNALEFIFLVDELHTDVLKTDRGVYIVSRKNINDLLREQEKDTIHYAKKMREYALSFLPKEGEPISLNADEVLYWVRNGMLRRPKVNEGNKVFTLSPGLQEVCLDLKEDFVNAHYALAIVSHADFIKIKERRVERKKNQKQKTIMSPTNILKEGRLELFSDNTRRMKLGERVVVYDSSGKRWTENLKGEKIEDEYSGHKRNSATSSGSVKLDACDFIEKESKKILQEAEGDEVETKLPSLTINKSIVKSMRSADIPEQKKIETKNASDMQDDLGRTKEKQEKNKVAAPSYVPRRNLPIVDGFFEHLEDPHAKAFFKQKIFEREFPFGFIRQEESVYVSVKSLLEMTSDYLSDSASEAFASETRGKGRSITDHNLARFYEKLEGLKIVLFQDRFRRSDFISFKKDEKKYSIRVLKVLPSFCVGLDIKGVTRMDVKSSARKRQDVYIDFSEQIIKGVQGTIEFAEKSTDKNPVVTKSTTLTPISLREERARRETKKVIPVQTLKPKTEKVSTETEEKPNIPLSEKKPSIELSSSGGDVSAVETKKEATVVNIPVPEPKTQASKEVARKGQLKQKMRKETFLKKFCSTDRLFSEKVFEKMPKDCEQFYYTFRINPNDSKEAWLFFSQERFKDMIYPFLEKEKIEFSPSNKFLNNFLRDDFKGDLSRRYIYTVPDGSVVAGRLVKLNVPTDMLEGLRLDVGYRGGYREVELKKALDMAKDMGDTSLSSELQALADAIHSECFVECEKE